MTTALVTSPAVEWAEKTWVVPETGGPILLRPWQRVVLAAMFPPDGSRSRWETFLLTTVKKSGKTTLNAIATRYAALTFPAPETVYCVANDEAQAQERVFDLIATAVRAMGLERRARSRSEDRDHLPGDRDADRRDRGRLRGRGRRDLRGLVVDGAVGLPA